MQDCPLCGGLGQVPDLVANGFVGGDPKRSVVLSAPGVLGSGQEASQERIAADSSSAVCEQVVSKSQGERLDVRKPAATSLALGKLPSNFKLSKAKASAAVLERYGRLRSLVGERAWKDFGWEVLSVEHPEYVKFLLDRWDFCGGKDRYGRVIANAGGYLGGIAQADGKLGAAVAEGRRVA